MRVTLVDLRRSIFNRWFLITIFGTLALFWIGLGPLSSVFIGEFSSGYKPPWNSYLCTALTSSTSTLTLPALAALPYSGAALHEIQTNACRYVLLRSGRKSYSTGKSVSCLVSSVLGQLFPLIIVIILGFFFCTYDEGYIPTVDLLNTIVSRLICAGIWGLIAGVIGILIKISSAVYIAPLAVSFSLSLIGRRLLPKIDWLDPEKWLKGNLLFFLIFLLIVMGIFYFSLLYSEVKKHA